jgi:protein-S-isoprenylcysteine O-methyltransferase Ste14
MWIVVGAITWRWRLIAFYDNSWLWMPAALLIACGLWIYSQARHDFSTDQVLGRSELQPDKHEQRLNTRGIRGRVRHPYYLAHACELLGWTIGTGLFVLYALLAFAVATGVFMIRAEEKELERRFGASYRDYKRRVPPLIPRVRGVKP